MQTDHKSSNVSSTSHDLDSNRHRDTSSKMVLLRKKKKKKLEDAIYKTMMLVTWDKDKDNKEKNIQRNKRKCRNG